MRSPSPARRRSAARSLIALTALGLALLCVGVLTGSQVLMEETLGPLVGAVIVVGSIVRCVGRARVDRSGALMWLCFAAAGASWMAGEVVRSTFFPDATGFPEPYDAGYLAYYPFMALGLVRLVRLRLPSFHASVVLDGAIAMIAVGAATAAAIVPVILAAPEGEAAFDTLVFPLCDVMLVSLAVAALALSGWRPTTELALVAGSLVLFSISDVAMTIVTAGEGITASAWIGIGWIVAIGLLGVAAAGPAGGQRGVRPGAGMFFVPVIAALAAIALLVAGNFRTVAPSATILAATALLLVMVRTGVTFRENADLVFRRHQALTDDLTGLVNRRGLNERIEAAFATGDPVGLLLIDLDRFKDLNDTLGHHLGDRMLADLGTRLQNAVPATATVARLGGDEFAVLLSGAAVDRPALAAAAAAIERALDEPFLLDGLTLRAQGSIGGALAPVDAADAIQLLQRADVAMYQAKRGAAAYAPYAVERDVHSRARLALVEDLRAGIGRGELEVHYQPRADVVTRQIVGVEALVRWRHPVHGLIYPDTFIELAEEAGLMGRLTSDVIMQAFAQGAAWQRAGLDLSVSVNLSMSDVMDDALPSRVGAMLWETGMRADRVVLEITEDIAMADPDRVVGVLGELRALGLELALDDFGTGYSSLAHLRRLRVQELKIDRSFVMRLLDEPENEVIVRATADLGRNLGLRVVAEGVEHAEAWRVLGDCGCALAQGYDLSPPVPAGEIPALVARPAVAAAA